MKSMYNKLKVQDYMYTFDITKIDIKEIKQT